MTKAECIRELQAEYQNQRTNNERELDNRISEAGRVDPEIIRLREENASLALTTLKRIMSINSEEDRRIAAEQMKQRGIFNNHEIRRRLVKAGFPADYLTLSYRCKVCRDTGYVGEAPSRFCECFEKRLRLKQYEDGSMAGIQEQNFDQFNEKRSPEAGGQLEQLVLTRRACEDYANNFPHTHFLNIVLTGAGGLGKTFLLNSIFERVISRGHSAVRITAFRMHEAMRKQHFANSAEDMAFDPLIEAPLLLIDDLGSEPITRNITIEYLFTLLNERIAAKRHTVVATNLSPAQLKDRYGERVFSRLLDRTLCATMKLEGKDLRLL